MEKKYSIETSYILDEVAHTSVYTDKEREKAKFDFVQIRKHENVPVRMLGIIDGKKFDVRKGDDYDFDSLALTVDVKLESGSVISYLCRTHIRGTYVVRLNKRDGTTKEVGCTVLTTKRRTDEELMNLRNEGNFDKFWFIEDVIVRKL